MKDIADRRASRTLGWAALAAACLVVAPSPAGAIEDLLTPRSVALGNSLRGAATGGLGPLLNPAGMALSRGYHIDLTYGFGIQDLGSNLYLSIVDSITSRVAAGVYYKFVHTTPRFAYGSDPRNNQAIREGNEAGLSLAVPIGQRFSFGATTKYTTVSTTVPNPAYDPTQKDSPKRIPVDSTTTQADAKGFTIDAGLALKLGDRFNIGVAGYNLIPKRSIEAPIALGSGLSFSLGKGFLAAADVVVYFNRFRERDVLNPDGTETIGRRLTTVRVGGGVEYVAGGRVPLRVGAYYDNGLPGTYISAGSGYQGRRFGVDVSYRQKVGGGRDTLLVAGVRVFLQ